MFSVLCVRYESEYLIPILFFRHGLAGEQYEFNLKFESREIFKWTSDTRNSSPPVSGDVSSQNISGTFILRLQLRFIIGVGVH